MSTATEDFEQALWENSFYSSTAAITQLSSSNHIHNLKKTVNIPHSELSQLITTGLLESYPDETTQSMDVKLRQGQKRTSLMKVSPSMKALEKALNSDAHVRSTPEVILEENESPDTSLEPVVFQNSKPTIQKPQMASIHTNSSRNSVYSDESEETIRAASDDATQLPKIGQIEQDQPISEPQWVPMRKDLSTPDQKTLARIEFERKESFNSQTSQPPQEQPLPASRRSNSYTKRSNSYSRRSNSHKSQNREHDTNAQHEKNRQMLDAAFVPKSVYRPVKSMLDAVEPAESKKPRKDSNVLSRDISGGSASAMSSKSSSVFGTPKSPARIPESIPQRSPKRNGVRTPKAEASNNVEAASPLTQPNNKRFSFRGLFKLKSKLHSLGNIKEEKPSEPRKLHAKSPSTPNFQEVAQSDTENKSKSGPTENIKGIFRRRKSQSSMDFLSEDLPKTMSKSVTDTALSLRSKPLPKIQGRIEAEQSKPKNKRSLPKLPEPEPLDEPYKSSPQLSEQLAYMDTPATGVLSAESDTIREVDDSDYSLRASEKRTDQQRKGWEPQTPVQENDELEDDLTEDFHHMSLMEELEELFGSPFLVPMPMEDTSRQSYPKPLSDILADPVTIPRLESGRVSIGKKEQLVGEALFPKSLSSHEVESIISLERSISMRSLRSNGKRSSFLNYNGSDENVLLGSEVGIIGLNQMKRSGSILKNSLSSRSLRTEVLTLIDAALDEDTTEELINGAEADTKVNGLELQPKKLDQINNAPGDRNSFDENLSLLIEFSDFIDFDNLDFSSTNDLLGGEPFDVELADGSLLASSPVLETSENVELYNDDEISNLHENESIDDVRNGDRNSRNNYEISPARDFEFGVNGKNHTTSPTYNLTEHEVIVVNSSTDHDFSQLPELVDTSYPETLTGEEPVGNDIAFGMGLSEPQKRESPSLAARPFSMSFKGFNGTLAKSKVTGKHGLHQLLQFCNESSNDLSSVVGQGFGSSDDDLSEDEREMTDDYLHAYSLSADESSISTAVHPAPPKVNKGSAERRQEHLKNVLQLQPPLQTMPFHHDRIPSISDQSAASSPRLLTSFIGRLRKSPPSHVEKRSVKFSSRIILYDTYHPEEYDRHPDVATCNQLTPLLAQQIKEELNEFKAAMIIHSSSRENTHFF